jgi:hypothetical protein
LVIYIYIFLPDPIAVTCLRCCWPSFVEGQGGRYLLASVLHVPFEFNEIKQCII